MRMKTVSILLLIFFTTLCAMYADSDFDLDLDIDPDDDFYFFEEFFIQEDIMSAMSEDLSMDDFDDYFFDDFDDFDYFDDDFAEDDLHDSIDPLDFLAPTIIVDAPSFEMRTFNDLFPHFPGVWLPLVYSENGLRHSFSVNEYPVLYPNPDLDINLIERVMEADPSHLIEALLVIPYTDREYDLLDIFNALGRIENIKDYPANFNNNEIFIFSDSHRIDNPQNRIAIPDPPPSTWLPASQTMYLRLREIYIGNLFLRGDITVNVHSITYSMTNFIDVRYFFIPIVRTERFAALIYIEPVTEGLLIYSVAGFYLPSFFADRMNLTPNINRRIEVFIRWITDGLRL
ncbi:MAG: hypothetical protein FWG77_03735 [Treponema sp.]|nr:hypothetical protein [Treponema sp.]